MSAELLRQIDMLEKACQDALARHDDAEMIDVLVRTLTTVRFSVSDNDRAMVRGLANLATAHADMLLHGVKSKGSSLFVKSGLEKLCAILVDFRDELQSEVETAIGDG